MKYASIDIETTGLNAETDQILEFGCVLDDLADRKPLEGLPRFHCYVVHDTIRGHPRALAMNAEILRRIAERPSGFLYLRPGEVIVEFKAFLEREGFRTPRPEGGSKSVTAAGKNFAGFDLRFIEKLPGFRDERLFKQRVIDPAVLYWKEGDEALPDTKACYLRAGMDGTVAHTAVEDALGVVRLIRVKMPTLGLTAPFGTA